MGVQSPRRQKTQVSAPNWSEGGDPAPSVARPPASRITQGGTTTILNRRKRESRGRKGANPNNYRDTENKKKMFLRYEFDMQPCGFSAKGLQRCPETAKKRVPRSPWTCRRASAAAGRASRGAEAAQATCKLLRAPEGALDKERSSILAAGALRPAPSELELLPFAPSGLPLQAGLAARRAAPSPARASAGAAPKRGPRRVELSPRRPAEAGTGRGGNEQRHKHVRPEDRVRKS